MTGDTTRREKDPWRCRLFGCDFAVILDPGYRQHGMHGRLLLRRAPVQCVRCGRIVKRGNL